jgi:hypothetical protein
MTIDYKIQIYTKIRKNIILYFRNHFVVRSYNGQALLTAILIIFVAIMALGTAALAVAMAQTNISQNYKLNKQAYNLAESGLENVLMRFSHGDYSTPPPLSDGFGSSTITLSGSSPSYQILAVGEIVSPLGGGKKATKKIQANVVVSDGIPTVTARQEIY